MKKIFAWVLVLMMVVGLFAGCNGTEDPTTPPAADSNLASAMEYLEAMYKEVGEKTPKDYTRPASIPYGTERYAITWTTNSDEVKVVDNGDGTVTIDINEAVTADVNYELTATMTDANGKTATYTWKHLLPAATGDQTAIVNDAYALESGASMGYEVTLTGKIIAVNTPYAADYKNVTVTIAVPGAEDKPIMCYRLKGDGADLIDNGWTITVTGTIKNYNGTIEFDAGCVLDSYVEGEGVKQPEDPAQVVDEAYALADGESLPYTATLTGKIIAIDTPYSPDYGNITVTIAVEGSEDQPITCYRMKGTGVDDLYIGDTITVKGLIKNYKGTIEFDTGCQLTAVVPGERIAMPEDPYEILDAAYALARGEDLPYEVTLTGIVTTVDEPYSEEYNNITVSITLVGAKDQPIKCFRLKGDGIAKIKPSDTITVKGYITNYEGEREFKSGCQLLAREVGPGYPAPATQEEIVEHIKTLPITCTLLYKAKLTGEIVKVNQKYSAKYGNITVTIGLKDASGNDYNLKIYRMKQGNGLDEIKKGDVITVEGYITNYVFNWEDPIKNSEVEMINAKLLSIEAGEDNTASYANFAEMVAAAAQLGDNETLGVNTTQTGVVVGTPYYNSKYSSWNFTLDVDGVEIYCYSMEVAGTTDLKKGDTVKVTGDLTAYKSKAQFSYATATATWISAGESSGETTTYETFAEMVEAAKSLANNDTLGVNTTQTGVVVGTPSYSSSHGNWSFTLDVDGVEIYCYGLLDGLETLNTGDTVKVVGDLTAYNGTPQFSYATATATVISSGSGDSGDTGDTTYETFAEMVEAAGKLEDNATLGVNTTQTGVVVGDPVYNSNYSSWNFTLDVEGVQIYCYSMAVEGTTDLNEGDTVTVTGDLTAYSGTAQFSYKTADATWVKAGETTENANSVKIVIADVADANSWTDTKVANGFTVEGITAAASCTTPSSYGQNTGKYYVNGENWRFYQNEVPSLVISVEGKTIATIKINYVAKNTGTLTLNGSNVASGTAVTVNAASATFSVGNTGTATNGNVQITSIEVTFAD